MIRFAGTLPVAGGFRVGKTFLSNGLRPADKWMAPASAARDALTYEIGSKYQRGIMSVPA
jgi:hypothetical protein